jgi:hypothetical protein
MRIALGRQGARVTRGRWWLTRGCLGLVALAAVALLSCGGENTVTAQAGSFQRDRDAHRDQVVLAAGDLHVTYKVTPGSGSAVWQATLIPMSGAATSGPAYRWGPFIGPRTRKGSVSVSVPGGRYQLSVIGRLVEYTITLAQPN